ncbi:MAG TPA: hypothetical protein VJZ71_15475 [Phycisphaerae bacterium]|nr:hypothetical protein [Phycisphaerae bacterium]
MLDEARARYANKIDAFIRSLPNQKMLTHFERCEIPLPVIALACERFAKLRGLMRELPARSDLKTAAEFLEYWTINMFRDGACNGQRNSPSR